MQIAKKIGDRIASRDDSDLIMQLMSHDCGGLSTMTDAVEACFRIYVLDAICRLKQTTPYLSLRYRFQECFSHRPKQECADLHVFDACLDLDAPGSIFGLRDDDNRLVQKLSEDDCGGLSKMPKNIEGCFRKYVWEAIDHKHRSDSYLRFVERFVQCFANRPELPCSDLIFRTDVLAGS